jgi:hypothetical protein
MKLRRSILSLAVVAFAAAASMACMGELDPYSAGVVFNKFEPFVLSKLYFAGTEGINYLRSCTGDLVDPLPGMKQVQPMLPNVKYAMYRDFAAISQVAIRDNFLSFSVSYGGGCKIHEFWMLGETTLQESMPQGVLFRLSHNANGDMCKALITETMQFDMLKETAYFGSRSPVLISIAAPQDTVKPSASALWYPDNDCTIRYRSHYAPGIAMVVLSFLEDQTPANANFASYPTVAIVVDPKVQLFALFNYQAAMTAELTWLSEQGVLSGLSATDAQKFGKSTSRGSQFWTLQDTAMPFNATFTGEKDSTGKGWVVLVKRGCANNVVFGLPPQSIGSSGVKTGFKVGTTPGKPIVARVGQGKISVNHPARGTISDMRLMNAKGERIASRFSFDAKGIVMYIDRSLSSGWYAVSFTNAHGSITVPIMVMP